MKFFKAELIIFFLAAIFFCSGCTEQEKAAAKKAEPKPVEVKVSTGPPKGGDFTLQSADGPLSLSDFKGNVVTLFFGYTACPTACPTSLETMANAFSRLSVEEMTRVQGIFVGIDPDRDTPEKLKEYAGYFHDRITGVTGSVEEVKAAAGKYGAFFIKSVEKESEIDYAFSHSTETYLIDAEGRLAGVYSEKTKGLELSEAIRRQLWKK